MQNEASVVIPLNRYEILLDIETRVNVAVERIKHETYVKPEDILWILGTDIAIELAQELRDKSEREMEEFRKKHETDYAKFETDAIEVEGVTDVAQEERE